MVEKICEIAKGILEFVYPPNIYCISCGNIIDKSRPYSLCDSCIKTFHWSVKKTCEKCGKPLRTIYDGTHCTDCVSFEHKFHKGYSCVEYSYEERKLIHNFKYKGEAHLMKPMAEAMFHRIEGENLEINIILPVPMYKKKEEIRGYNQAHLLAKSLSKNMNVAYGKNILLRACETEAMSSLNLEERKENIKNVIQIEKGMERHIEGKTILLVDDIYTTGSTVDACSDVLLKNGAKKIYIYAFAAGM